jgi:prepilin-type processing-associated H-X9-DG protein
MQCLSNLRTLGLGLQNYANLYRGCIMAADYDSPPVQGNTVRWCVAMMEQGLEIKTYRANETRDELKSFVCPDEAKWYADYAGHSPWRTNYSVNDTVMDNVDFETQPIFMRMDNVTKPSKTGVIADGNLHYTPDGGSKAFNRLTQINPNYPAEIRVDWRHNGACNLLYLDGHASSQPKALDMVGISGQLWE